MKVLEARAMGMCFGVRDALATAREHASPQATTVFGELVHNEEVLRELRQRGYRMTAESARSELPPTSDVMITAHGVSDAERQRLLAADKTLVDTTCPLVERAHQAALRLERECDLVLVLGKPGHVEVRGLTGDLRRVDVLPDVSAVRCYFVQRLGVLSQTTFPAQRAERILRALRQINPGTAIRYVDTICEPTRQRIRAVEELAPRVDAMVVVGGASSNNTKELARLCESFGVRAFHVQTADDLDASWFDDCTTLGITAGTSTTDETIRNVRNALLRIRPGA